VQESVQRFVEQMGLMCENEGLPRNAGRMLGLLLAEDGPFSLDELADELQASKASVSTNARMLEQQGMIRRVGAPGDRRDFYQMDGDPWESMLDVARVRWRQMVRVLEEAASELPAEHDGGRKRLRDAARFHALLLESSQKLVEAWRERRGGGPDAAPPAGSEDASK
jgi:DNA-binding transcriptional regulator GbsR (MarR family)